MAYTLIHYDLTNISQKNKVTVLRTLFGYTTKTHKGKYKYKIKPLLSEKNFIRPFESTIVLKKSREEKTITKLLDKYKVKYKTYKIYLKSSDFPK